MPDMYRSDACRLVRICRFHVHELLMHDTSLQLGGKQLTVAFKIR